MVVFDLVSLQVGQGRQSQIELQAANKRMYKHTGFAPDFGFRFR